jgi:hypothetical protein
MNEISRDLFIEIATFIDPLSLSKLSQCSKHWYNFFNLPLLWRELYRLYFFPSVTLFLIITTSNRVTVISQSVKAPLLQNSVYTKKQKSLTCANQTILKKALQLLY